MANESQSFSSSQSPHASVLAGAQPAADDVPTVASDIDEVVEQSVEDRKDVSIPGAIVALIFGVFGILIIARRNVR